MTLSCGPNIDLIVGSDYYAADSRAVSLAIPTPTDVSWAAATISIILTVNGVSSSPIVANAGWTTTGPSRTVAFDVPHASYAALPKGLGTYSVNVILADTHVYTAIEGTIHITS